MLLVRICTTMNTRGMHTDAETCQSCNTHWDYTIKHNTCELKISEQCTNEGTYVLHKVKFVENEK